MNAALLGLIIASMAVNSNAGTSVGDTAFLDRLEFLDAGFDRLAQGKNVVWVSVRNPTPNDLVFGIHIYARSPDFGRGYGTGRQYFESIKAGQSETHRFIFKMMGEVTPATYVKLRFYSLPSEDEWDYETPDETHTFVADQLPVLERDAGPEVDLASDVAAPVLAAFHRAQQLLKESQYEEAWNAFTRGWRSAESFDETAAFASAMKAEGRWFALNWRGADFVALIPKSLRRDGEGWTLTAEIRDETWTIDFVDDEGTLRLDRVIAVPLALGWRDWAERLQQRMEMHSTEHYDIYYEPASYAAGHIDRIAEQREQAYREIIEFIDRSGDMRIELYLFEDGITKWAATGHQGAGWAVGDRLVEIYSASTMLDPYHEPTHVLTSGYGNPPAAFNEGFAVYLADHLGETPGLRMLGGGDLSVSERARQLRNAGVWIPLVELLGYTEIGPVESRPLVSYAQAAAFVEYLIDVHGRKKFFKGYGRLVSSDDEAVRRENIRRLEMICGQSLQQIEDEWTESMR